MAPRFDSPAAAANPNSFSRPKPGPPKSQAHLALVRVQNRRREYLERNPLYFKSGEHELADPLRYDALVRRYQSPAEREEEGRKRGYARVLEGSLMRGEERLAKLAEAEGSSSGSVVESRARDAFADDLAFADDDEGDDDDDELAAAAATSPKAKRQEKALEQWVDFLRERFIRGGDEDFEYEKVDNDEEYDVLERMEQEEAWFEDEDPEWASDAESPGDGKAGGAREQGRVERVLEGETGIQDY